MNHLSPIVIFLSSGAFIPGFAQSEPTDTIKSKNLDEVVVEARQQSTSAKVSRYIPDKRVKNAATNAIDLLKRMAIPQLSTAVGSDAVTTAAGEEVSLFINYLPAAQQDIYGLRTTDVKSIEYMDFPDDPRFNGAQHVVNIIVQEYEFGGYTKISDAQFVLSSTGNTAEVFSKFAYRKMVYDLYVRSQTYASVKAGNESYSTFKLPQGDARRDQTLDGDYKSYYLPVTFRAVYNTQKMTVANTLGFTFSDIYQAKYDGSLSITPAHAGDSYRSYLTQPAVSRSLVWNGDYFFILPHAWSLKVAPRLSYDRNSRYSDYRTDIPGSAPIINNAYEDILSGSLQLSSNKKFGSRHGIGITMNTSLMRNDIDYRGNAPYDSKFDSFRLNLLPSYTFSLQNLYWHIGAGFDWFHNTSNGITEDRVNPWVSTSLSYSPSNRHQIAFILNYFSDGVGGADRSTNILQTNEFLYRTGNPGLYPGNGIVSRLTYTFLPSRAFNMSVYGSYNLQEHPITTLYRLTDDGQAILTVPENNGNASTVTVGVNLTWRLLNGSLILQGSPKLDYYHRTGEYRYSHPVASAVVQASYYLRSFYFGAYYATRNRLYHLMNGAGSFYPQQYGVAAGWANESWNVSVNASNFARTSYLATKTHMSTPLFESLDLNYSGNIHAGITFNVIYTIGYGKKIQRGNEVGAQTGGTSAIL